MRHSAATPRRGCFSGYLDDAAATEAAWRGGWFHTGDVVSRGPDGMLHFVDRKKNIIRRSGENIAAAEVEAVLLTHPDVAQAAVMAVKDELREEEVLACVVLKRPLPAGEARRGPVRHCYERLAYYKAPGWMHIVDSLPDHGHAEDPEAHHLSRRAPIRAASPASSTCARARSAPDDATVRDVSLQSI